MKKETKEKLKAWIVEYHMPIMCMASAMVGSTIGHMLMRSQGLNYLNGYDQGYATGVHDGILRGALDKTVDMLIDSAKESKD